MTKHMSAQRKYLVQRILDDKPPSVPLYKHLQEWQDLSDPSKRSLIINAMGQYFKNEPIPNRTLRRWIKDHALLL